MLSAHPVILVVEDDHTTRALLQELLEGAGYTVASAADGAAGQGRLEAGGIDLVVLDRRLPDRDGLEVCHWVRAREGSSEGHVPIIMLTAGADEAEHHAGLVAGADDYVTKPFDIDELLERVQAWLRTSQHPREDATSADDH
jgi:DNA-binding response OmpR family regulator